MPATLIINASQDIEYSSFLLHNRSLTPIGSPTFEQWETVGQFIAKANNACVLWLGDWINYGEARRWGEKYSLAVAKTSFKKQTLENAAYVDRNVDFSRRRETLDFSDYAEVASLKPQHQEMILEKAEVEHLSVREIR